MTTMRRALSGLLAAALAISVMALTGPGAIAGPPGHDWCSGGRAAR